MNDGVKAAIKVAGGVAPLARRMGVVRGTVYHWLNSSITLENALRLEKETGVSRRKIRPDVWGRGPAPAK